jgi:digeranylgeranylglycerophospholipid reductase
LDYDVVVVGAGPAGAISARFSAEKGARTLLLDRKREIGVPVRCAEVVAGGLTKDFGLKNTSDWLVARTHIIRLMSPSGRKVNIKMDPYEGFVLDRAAFEKELVRMAVSSGCDLRLGTPVTELVKNGLVLNGEKISAGIVIACDGVDSRIGRQAGLKTKGKLGMLGSCAQHTLVGIDVDPDVLEFDLGSNYAPGGYSWIFPKGKDEANVGVGILRSHKKNAKKVLDEFVSKRFKDARSVRFTSGCVPSAMPPGTTVKGNVMLVGDSARQVNAFTGAGIANSFIAGKIAGELAGEVAAKKQPISRLLEYERSWREVMEKNLQRSLKMRDRIMFDDRKIERFCLLLNILPNFILRRFLGRLHY